MKPSIEGLRRYFGIERAPRLTPEEQAEARILGEVLNESGATELLLRERNASWSGRGRMLRAEELIKDKLGVHRLETALAFSSEGRRTVVAVGAQRIQDGFGVYVARDQERLYTGQVGDERLPLELSRAFGRITMYLRIKGMA